VEYKSATEYLDVTDVVAVIVHDAVAV